MTNLLLAAMLALTAGGQTPTTTTVNAAGSVSQTARTDSGDNGRQRVCVRQQEGTGTILSHTICRTRDEWQRSGGLPTQNNR